MLAAGREFIAPGELGAVETAARGKFPFGFGRQILAGPFGVGERIAIGDVHDRMIVEPVDVALRPVGMAPVRAFEQVHHWLQSRRSTGRRGGVKTSEPA